MCVTGTVHTRLVPCTAASAWRQPRCQVLGQVPQHGPWALSSLILLRLCLVFSADAWRMEGQHSPSYLGNSFWAWLIASILTTTSCWYNLIWCLSAIWCCWNRNGFLELPALLYQAVTVHLEHMQRFQVNIYIFRSPITRKQFFMIVLPLESFLPGCGQLQRSLSLVFIFCAISCTASWNQCSSGHQATFSRH